MLRLVSSGSFHSRPCLWHSSTIRPRHGFVRRRLSSGGQYYNDALTTEESGAYVQGNTTTTNNNNNNTDTTTNTTTTNTTNTNTTASHSFYQTAVHSTSYCVPQQGHKTFMKRVNCHSGFPSTSLNIVRWTSNPIPIMMTKRMLSTIVPNETRLDNNKDNHTKSVSAGYVYMERYIRAILDPQKSPLGTLTHDDIKSSVEVVKQFCTSGNGGGGGGDASQGEVANTDDKPNLYQLDYADKLSQRLAYECASGNYWARQQSHVMEIMDLYPMVLKGWMKLGGRIGVERSELILQKMVDFYSSGRPIVKPNTEQFLTLTEMWLDLRDNYYHEDDAKLRAAEILLFLTNDEDNGMVFLQEEYKDQVTELFHRTLKRLLQSHSRVNKDEAVDDMKVSFVKRMEELHDSGWSGMKLDSAIHVSLSKNPPSYTSENLRKEGSELSGNVKTTSSKEYEGENYVNAVDAVNLRRQFDQIIDSAGKEDVDTIENHFDQLERLAQPFNNGFQLDTGAYDSLIEFYANTGSDDVPHKMTSVLQRMDQLFTAGEISGALHRGTFHHVLKLWAKSNKKEAPWRAQEILLRMQELYDAGNASVKPTTQTYNFVADAWLRSDERVAAEKIEKILERMKEVRQAGDFDAKPDFTSYCNAIVALSRDDYDKETAQKIVKYFREFFEQDVGADKVDPSNLSHCLITAMDSLSKYGWGREAEEILNRILQYGVKPTSSMYESLVRAHLRRGNVFQIIPILDRFERLCEESKMDVGHLGICFETAIVALIRSKKEGSNEKARKMLTHLLDLYKSGNPEVAASVVGHVFDSALNILKIQKQSNDAEDVLKQLETSCLNENDMGTILTVSSFVHVMKLWADLGRVDKVEEIFNRLLEYYRTGHANLKPNVASFGILLKSISKSTADGAAKKADKILRQMIDIYQQDPQEDVLDDGLFNSVILAYKDIGDEEALDRACEIINQMIILKVKPSAFTFNTVLHALMKSQSNSASAKATNLLNLMIQNYKGGNTQAKPDAFTFNAVMGALAKSRDAMAVEKICLLHQRMEQLDVEPNVYGFNILLDACALARGGPEEKRAALKVAVETMGRLRQTPFSPDVVSYNTLLKAYRNLVPEGEDRDKLIASTFKTCCVDGMMTKGMLGIFRNMLSKEIGDQLCSNVGPAGEIPADWSRNVRKLSP